MVSNNVWCLFYLCSWRFVFYLVSFTAGLGSLINVSLLVASFFFKDQPSLLIKVIYTMWRNNNGTCYWMWVVIYTHFNNPMWCHSHTLYNFICLRGWSLYHVKTDDCLIFQTPWFWDHRECWRGYPKQVSRTYCSMIWNESFNVVDVNCWSLSGRIS